MRFFVIIAVAGTGPMMYMCRIVGAMWVGIWEKSARLDVLRWLDIDSSNEGIDDILSKY